MSDDSLQRLNAALEGRYRVERELASGGMATVYLADDLRHERKVAVKVLKPELAAVVGAERFLTEIKTTANLQHPHILPLFDSGEADGFLFYVMPYVEGESLRERLDREHQLPVDDALRITANVAEALEYAHAHGVVHRDVKPANILLQAGKPVISDFGIALAAGIAGGGRLTETGLSLGTPHYMSPEQATGDQAVGGSADIYALGCVLYEMLIGEPPYTGSTAQAVLGKIVTGDPDPVTKHRRSVPANVDAAIRRSLEKLPADRFGSAQDFARALSDPGFAHRPEATGSTLSPAGPWKRVAMLATALAVTTSAAALWLLLTPETRQSPFWSEIVLPEGLQFVESDDDVNVAIGPDGIVVFRAGTDEGTRQLWLRRPDQLTPVPIPGTRNAVSPRFAPDGESIVFRAGAISTMRLDGSLPQTVVSSGGNAGLAWGPDRMIYFSDVGEGLRRIALGGGEVEEVRRVSGDEVGFFSPDVLPNGKAVLVSRVVGPPTRVEAALLILETGDLRVLFTGSGARYAASGHIVYTASGGTLHAVPFDQDRLVVTGGERTILQDVSAASYASQFAISRTGFLVFAQTVRYPSATELVWVSRSGDVVPLEGDARIATSRPGWTLSRDGTRVALSREVDGNTDIWTKRLPDGPFERLTTDPAPEWFPAWSNDGLDVLYEVETTGVWRRRADGTGAPEHLVRAAILQGRLSPVGDWMVLRTSSPTALPGDRDVVGFRVDVDSVPAPLIADPEFQEQDPDVSHDGRWLAYSSDATGRPEVYVVPFPDVSSGRDRVSDNGGFAPLWAPNGSELFFVDAERYLVAARFETEPSFRRTGAERLFQIGPEFRVDGGNTFYDVASDGQRFLMARLAGPVAAEPERGFVVIQDFFEELGGERGR